MSSPGSCHPVTRRAAASGDRHSGGSRYPERPARLGQAGSAARERRPGEALQRRLTVHRGRWGSRQAGPPIPNGRSQAAVAGLDTLPIVAVYRSLGGTPGPAGRPTPQSSSGHSGGSRNPEPICRGTRADQLTSRAPQAGERPHPAPAARPGRAGGAARKHEHLRPRRDAPARSVAGAYPWRFYRPVKAGSGQELLHWVCRPIAGLAPRHAR